MHQKGGGTAEGDCNRPTAVGLTSETARASDSVSKDHPADFEKGKQVK